MCSPTHERCASLWERQRVRHTPGYVRNVLQAVHKLHTRMFLETLAGNSCADETVSRYLLAVHHPDTLAVPDTAMKQIAEGDGRVSST